MKKACTIQIVLIVIFLLFFAPLKSQTPIWQDNFDGPNINSKVWTFDVGASGFGNNELEYYTDRTQNAYIENGSLVIQANKEYYIGSNYTSARLKTDGHFAFKYGIIEARIKLPNLKNGLWPAFWTLGTDFGIAGWPQCGELDIMEAGSQAAWSTNTVNQTVSAATHWFIPTNSVSAMYSLSDVLDTGAFYERYHNFEMVWDSTHVAMSLDSVQYFVMNTTGIPAFQQPQFVLLNLAVGGTNYVDITDTSLITAPFPAKMYVDYVRIYPIVGQTQIINSNDSVIRGNYGIYTETGPVDEKLQYDSDAHLYIWSNMQFDSTVKPYEGTQVLSYDISSGTWYGMGIQCNDKNMSLFSDGILNFEMRTTSTDPISVGVCSTNGGSSYVSIPDTGTQYGLVRDGQWHTVQIPLNLFSVDFYTINQPFMVTGNAPSSNIIMDIDNIYWIPSGPRPTPQNGKFGIYTDTTTCTMKFLTPQDGNIYVWSNTLVPLATTPYEGTNVLSFQSAPGQSWFGLGLTPNIKYNLTAFSYPNSFLHFQMKTTSTTTFQIGMKSGNETDLGQYWVNFENGADPYGFVRDGNWHSIDIPMSTFDNVDLLHVSQLFELLGTNGPISNIAIDNIYLDGAGPSYTDSTALIIDTIHVTGVKIEPDTVSIAKGTAFQLKAEIIPSDATNTNVTWASSDTSIVKVSQSGTITGNNVGIAKIIVTTIDSIKRDTAYIQVTPPVLVTRIIVSPDTLSVRVGSKAQLSDTIYPLNATNQNISWSSSNVNIATVSATGLVTPLITGKVTIKATTLEGDISDSSIINVLPPISVQSISVFPHSLLLIKGSTKQLTDSISPKNAYNQSVIWTSDNNLVATVSENGIVSAIDSGKAAIIVKTLDGSKTDTCQVKVNPPLINLALNKPIVSSSDQSGFTASGANDGNPLTRWSSAFADPQWIVIDLLADYNINQVILLWETASAQAYTIQLSLDSVNWNDIYSTTKGTGGDDTLNVTGKGRYIMMDGTVRNTAYGYSLWEFEVFGTPINEESLVSTAKNQVIKPTIYPNPVKEQGTIDLGTGNDFQRMQIIDMTGRIIFTQSIGPESLKFPINLSYLGRGVYIIRLEGNCGIQEISFIKE